MCSKKYPFLPLLIVLLACQRNGLAPVEVKLDDDGNIVGYSSDSGNSTYNIESIKDNSVEDKREREAIETYTVQAEDTLESIGEKTKTDPVEISQLNGVYSSNDLREGQVLRLPDLSKGNNLNANEKAMPFPDEENPEQKQEKVEEDDKNLDKKLAVFLSTDKARNITSSSGVASPKKSSVVQGEKDIVDEEIDENPQVKAPESSAPKKTVPIQPASDWILPVNGKIVSKFGDVVDGDTNDGIDIKAALGTPVKAASSGTVVFAGEGRGLDPGYGKTVLIKHASGDDVVSSYTHLNDIKVKNGAKVATGDVIGSVGQTGDVSEPKLHFEITEGEGAISVNPSKYIKF